VARLPAIGSGERQTRLSLLVFQPQIISSQFCMRTTLSVRRIGPNEGNLHGNCIRRSNQGRITTFNLAESTRQMPKIISSRLKYGQPHYKDIIVSANLQAHSFHSLANFESNPRRFNFPLRCLIMIIWLIWYAQNPFEMVSRIILSFEVARIMC